MKKKIKLKIFHGPHNVGGIGWNLSKLEKQAGYESEFIVYNTNPTKNNQDLSLNLKDRNFFIRPFLILFFFSKCLKKYNIFHFYFGRTFSPLNMDLPILKLFRKKMIMTYCGSEIRLVRDVEKKRNPYYFLLKVGSNDQKYDSYKKLMMRWQNLWIDKFFAVRELYKNAKVVIPKRKIVKDVYINNMLDISSYQPSFHLREIPTLIHATTNPSIKGSAFIEKSIMDLKKMNYKFNYKRLQGRPVDEVRNIYKNQADILIDQFLLGSPGTFAMEGMYYGIPVCIFIMDDILKNMPPFPIVNCSVFNLTEKLAWLINNPQERMEIGKAGREFVEKYCDQTKIQKHVLNIYKQLLTV